MAWHAPTLLLYSSLLMLSFLLGTALLWSRDRRDYLRDWALGIALSLVGLGLLSFQAQLPNVLGILLANLCALGCLLWVNLGLARLLDAPLRLRVLLPQALAFALLYALISVVWDLPAVRAILFNIGMLLLVASGLQRLLGSTSVLGRSVLVLPVLLYAVIGVAAVARAVHGLLNWDGTRQQLWEAQGPYIVVALLAWVALLQSLLTLHAARLLHDAERQAASDPLTGLLNRRGFEPLLAREWDRFKRQGQPLAVLMLDIDHFKAINDGYGHATGDEALRHLGQELRQRLRPYDLAARLGGEEFAVLLPGSDAEQALQTAERLRQLDWIYGRGDNGQPLRYTVSIGLACATPADAEAQALLRRADAALYRAKQSGRDRVEQG